MLSCLPLLEVLTYAEDDVKTICKRELGLLDELGVGLTVVLATLGVSENCVLATN